jgi:hypothetical protein
MKKLVLVFLLLSLKVNAWVLYPSMNVSNANSDMCIAANSKIGDKLRSASGSQNYALVKSTSGTSSRCQDTNNPILANVELITGASPKFTMEVPDEFKAQKMSDIYIFHGIVLGAGSEKDGRALYVYFRQRETTYPPETLMQATITGLNTSLKEPAIIKNQEELTINGMKAWRFEAVGTDKAIFARSITYQYTMLEGDNEYVIIGATAYTSNYEDKKQEMYTYAYKVSGIKSTSKSEASIEDAKTKCKAKGLKEKTEKFGACVLELIN